MPPNVEQRLLATCKPEPAKTISAYTRPRSGYTEIHPCCSKSSQNDTCRTWTILGNVVQVSLTCIKLVRTTSKMFMNTRQKPQVNSHIFQSEWRSNCVRYGCHWHQLPLPAFVASMFTATIPWRLLYLHSDAESKVLKLTVLWSQARSKHVPTINNKLPCFEQQFELSQLNRTGTPCQAWQLF